MLVRTVLPIESSEMGEGRDADVLDEALLVRT